jgi:hypothetical protein
MTSSGGLSGIAVLDAAATASTLVSDADAANLHSDFEIWKAYKPSLERFEQILYYRGRFIIIHEVIINCNFVIIINTLRILLRSLMKCFALPIQRLQRLLLQQQASLRWSQHQSLRR